MIRTICSSFLFLFPIYVCHKNNDTFHMMLFSIGMGVSVANHSHTFHPDKTRRLLFGLIDCTFMVVFAIYLLVDTFYRETIDRRAALVLATVNTAIFYQLGGENIELYTERQRIIHVIFHITGILTLTISRYGFDFTRDLE